MTLSAGARTAHAPLRSETLAPHRAPPDARRDRLGSPVQHALEELEDAP